GGAHGEADHANARVGDTPLGVVQRREEVVNLVVAERDASPEVSAMPIVVEKQHVVACAPERRADADEMPLVAAIANAADDDTVSLWARQPPGMDRMIAARGGKRHLFIVGARLEWRHGEFIHWQVT